MNLGALMQQAAASAESKLAQLQGAPAGEPNCHFENGSDCVGVFGNPSVEEVPQPGGGYRKRTVTVLTVTRPQLDAPPAAKSRVIRTDLEARPNYVIDRVGTQDPLHWVFYLVNFSA